MLLRAATGGDAAAIVEVYAPHVLTGLATFEEVPPSAGEMLARIEAVQARRLPWLVAENQAGQIIGYAYAGPYRDRAAYRFTVESSIYLAPDARGQGLGTQLMEAVLAALHGTDVREVVAVIGDSANHASINLHRKLGFAHIGTLRGVGHKFDRSVDTVIMQLSL